MKRSEHSRPKCPPRALYLLYLTGRSAFRAGGRTPQPGESVTTLRTEPVLRLLKPTHEPLLPVGRDEDQDGEARCPGAKERKPPPERQMLRQFQQPHDRQRAQEAELAERPTRVETPHKSA